MGSDTTTTTKASNSNYPPNTLQVDYSRANLKKQLITKEDHFHVHKILGISCLIHFIYRYSQIPFNNDMGFMTHKKLTLPTMALHLVLNLSSFEFHIPRQRIKHGGRIWPEARLHSLMFALRSISMIVWYWIEDNYGLERNYDMNILICILNLLLVDLSSNSQGKYRSNTIRGLDCSPAIKYFFSIMQFNSTAGLMIGIPKMTLPFLALFVIQLSAFLATMQRKNLIGYSGLAVYGGMLMTSFAVQRGIYRAEGPYFEHVVRIFALTAALWRMGRLPAILQPLQNKYVIWTSIGLAMKFTRPYWKDIPVDTMRYVLVGLVCAHLANYQFKKDYYKDDSIKSPLTTTKKVA